MKKIIIAILLGNLLVFPSVSQADGELDPMADQYFSKDRTNLTPTDQKALGIADRWKSGTIAAAQPVAGANGEIKFVYGVQQPKIICAVLNVCDISLQPGEDVISVNIGDNSRWMVDPAISGTGENQIQHLMIKPADAGIETSLAVTTNRRTYHFHLVSDRTRYMPRVSFTYPRESLEKWKMMQARAAQQRDDATIPATGEYLGNLSFDYTLYGVTPWTPIRVYNDGVKTIIQMPMSMAQTEAPALLVVNREKKLFSSPKTAMVNYRVQGDRYIVDAVFDEAIMIAGSGKTQQSVTIIRNK
ncbi:P-type conjugative transfer protein TrbG [Bartonella sp. DGB2]|uniref:P-type conjugative transfer protein TrbG n=1 Tax=Bartonella sp. DGB2 TaxID=3388426 RepID=UPI00398FBA7E